jgi:monoamine oxidase
MSEIRYDVLVIGAGAAGLAASRALHDAGCKVLVLEARDRIGGRIHTDETFASIPVELGAEFIHGDNAVTHDLVREAGLSPAPVVRMDNLWWAEGDQQALPLPQLPAPVRDALTQILAQYDDLLNTDLETDISLAGYLRGRGCDERTLQMADVLLAQTCSARLDSLSCADLLREMRADHAGHGEARIHEGYATLLDWYRRDINVEFNSAVTAVEWSESGVTIHTESSQFDGRACVITIPVGVLQRGAIRFTPLLSDAKQMAIAAFRVEPATKLIYAFREPMWPDELTFMAHDGLAARWWTPSYRREGAAVIACYITADRAREIDAIDEQAALALGLRELSQLLGVSLDELRAQCTASRRVSWASDPFALGGYAHIPPGAADARIALAQPEGDVLFFAGEATAYDTNPQTVHGAIESGWRAARECLEALRRH